MGIQAVPCWTSRSIWSYREWVRLLGFDEEGELLGRNMHHLVHHTQPDGTPYPEEECQVIPAHREGQVVTTDDEMSFRKDGTRFRSGTAPSRWATATVSRGRC